MHRVVKNSSAPSETDFDANGRFELSKPLVDRMKSVTREEFEAAFEGVGDLFDRDEAWRNMMVILGKECIQK